MIRAARIRELAARDGVRPEEVEKEYLQYAFLHSWATQPDALVFRGGTMLRVAHGHSRYSEDLDFVRRETVDEAEGSLQEAIDDVARWGLDVASDPPERSGRGTITWDVRFHGPLYAETGRENRVRLQAASTDDHVMPAVDATVRPKYEDIPMFVIPTQDRRETAAEKVRALVERDQARDAYDLYHLIEQGFAPDAAIVAQKLGWTRGDPPLRVQAHGREDYENDLRLFVPRRAHVAWETAWPRVRDVLDGLGFLSFEPSTT